MELKTITIKDYNRLIPFWQENYFVNEHDSKERFGLFLEKNPGLSIFAEEDGRIVGTVLGSYDGRRGYIQKLVVEKSKRRMGIGEQLVRKILELLHDAGVSYIPLTVEKELVSFYQHCGFRQTEQQAMNINL